MQDDTQSLSFCGAKDNTYPDPRGMGYPFDKLWEERANSDLGIEEVVENKRHIKLSEFTIYRKPYSGTTRK